MKKKIINANTMEILMNKNDLKRYRITVLDLLGDHKHVKNFFYRLLERIDNYHRFDTNKHLIFKILPSKDNLELIISKQSKSNLSALKFRSKELNKSSAVKKNHSFSNVIKFTNFEDVIKVAHLISINKGTSNLYLLHGVYYLELCPYLGNINKIKNELSMAYEYGNRTHLNHSFLLNNCKTIINDDALITLRHYFK